MEDRRTRHTMLACLTCLTRLIPLHTRTCNTQATCLERPANQHTHVHTYICVYICIYMYVYIRALSVQQIIPQVPRQGCESAQSTYTYLCKSSIYWWCMYERVCGYVYSYVGVMRCVYIKARYVVVFVCVCVCSCVWGSRQGTSHPISRSIGGGQGHAPT